MLLKSKVFFALFMGHSQTRPVVQHYRKGSFTITELEAVVRTGDLLLFEGHGIGSFFIRLGTWSSYTHVALVDRTILNGKEEVVLLWESVRQPDGCKCILKNSIHSGARLVGMRERIESYMDESINGRINVCCIKLEWGTCADDFIDKAFVELHKFEDQVVGASFESNKLTMARTSDNISWIAGKNQKDLSEYFCSELVAETFQRMGIMRNFESSACYPKQFYNGFRFPFVRGIDLSQRPDHVILKDERHWE